MADINLLPTDEKSSDNLGAIQKKLTFGSILILAIVAIFTVVTLVMFTQAKSQETQFKNRLEKAASDVGANQLAEELLTVVNKKADSANKIIDGRIIYTDVVTKIAELMPTDVYFNDLKISDTKLSTTAKAKTSADVANLVSSFVTSEEGKKLFSSVNIDSLATDEKGNYSFSVSMQLNQPKTQASTGAAQPTADSKNQ